MTSSIIRRFAKYHNVPIPDGWPLTIEHIRWAMESLDEKQRHPGAIEAARDRLIQTLTRIEDAEAAIYLAKAWAIGASQYNALHILANNLFESVYIDPAKWREVKE